MTRETVGPVPPAVLAAFGLSGPVTALSGGQGRSWRAAPAVLKPLDMDPAMLAWQAGVLSRLDGRSDFRVAPPLPALDGSWVVSGWTAWRHEPGRHRPQRWRDIVDVGRRLHEALATEPRPAALADRTDIWSVADRVAWGELPASRFAGTKHLAELTAALRPVNAPAQLVHGDLTGNVLFDEQLPPLVIDLSPYWRPAGFAAAVVVADALVFEAAGPEVVDLLGDDPDARQHLLRALIFRAVTDHLARPDLRRADDADPYLPAGPRAAVVEVNSLNLSQ